MNVQEAVNFRLNKLGFKEIWENQRKVVEAYFNGPDALIITPTGSEVSHSTSRRLFWIYLNMAKETSLKQFASLFLHRFQVSFLHEKGVNAVVLGPKSSETENKDASEGK